MEIQKTDCQDCELKHLCQTVRTLTGQGEYDQALSICRNSLAEHPDSPVVQNLIGIIDELKGNKSLALRHFAASSALGPGYCPAIHNLDVFGTVFGRGKPAFGDADCTLQKESNPWEIKEKDGVKYLERKHA